MSRIALITQLLTNNLHPSHLEVIDDSMQHIGHAGVKDSGAGHFTIKITSKEFNGKTQVKQHQLVYQAIGHLIGPEIHAICIEATSE